MKRTLLLLFTLAATLTVAAQRTQAPVIVELFQGTPVLFNPSDYPNGVVEKDGVTYLGNGRIALKKIAVPQFSQYTEAEIEITLVSNGDPWDKSGSCFVIPRTSAINMIDVAAGRAKYPPHDTVRYEQLPGIIRERGTSPPWSLCGL